MVLLSQPDHAVLSQMGHHLADAVRFHPKVTQMGLHLQALENGPRFFNGLVDPFRGISSDNFPNPLSVLKKLSTLLPLFNWW